MPLRDSRSFAVALVGFATFIDIVAYTIAVPVLPDLSRRLGASPTTIGLLFGSFGVTLLATSIPMGALSDRTGRKLPLAGGLLVLAAATLLFAFADRLAWLFAARLVQGSADAVTWVVGLALIADLYPADQRGRMAGYVMSGVGFAVMIGPSLGGWLYEIGGARLPFVAVALVSAAGALGFFWLNIPPPSSRRERVPVAVVVRTPAVVECAAVVVVVSATISMLEPVLALHLHALEIGPARIGLLFGVAAVATTVLNPVFGRLADHHGARRMTLAGLVASGGTLLLLGQAGSFASATVLYTLQASALALVITPSLAYMAEATTAAGIESFGVSYGLYNMAWGIGLLTGPAIGGFLFEHTSFSGLAWIWAPGILAAAGLIAKASRRAQVARGRFIVKSSD